MNANPPAGKFIVWVAVAITILAVTYAAYGLLLYGNQRKMMYFPTPESDAQAAVIELPSSGETLKIWQVGDAEAEDAVVYFGGNAEDVAWNIPNFAAQFPGRAVYLPNYRGYGGSTGIPSEAGLLTDALAVYDHIRPHHRRISVIGRSLGSGVAAHVAAEREVDKLALITPFDSALNLARKMFPLFPVSLMLTDHYDTLSRVPKISAPVLIIIAGQDRIIPRNRTDALVAAFPAAQIGVTVMEQANHHDISDAVGYGETLAGFLGE